MARTHGKETFEMASPYLTKLIEIARQDLPQLAYDLNNASTVYTVQEAAKKLHNIVTYLVHHIILSDSSVNAGTPSAAAQAKAQPQLPPPPPGHRYVRGQDGQIYISPDLQPAPPVGHAPALDHYPGRQPASYAAMPGPAPAGLPLIYTVPQEGMPPVGQNSPVTEVTITPQGARVALPSGVVAMLPPGSAYIDAASMMAPVAPQVAPDGYARPIITAPRLRQANPTAPAEHIEVTLPEGGGVTPEVAAALASRSGNQPVMGARNITDLEP